MNRGNTAALPVSLVIPGKNVERTIAPCLEAVCPLLVSGDLSEIIFVDDGSTDGSAAMAARYPVRVLKGFGTGPAAARNLGWREARSPLIWFVDADCVAEPDALKALLDSMNDLSIAAVGGSYNNAVVNSTLACLIHEEIVERHFSMPPEVDYLATFNVLYRREMLEQVGGFDEYFKTPSAEDVELAYRIWKKGGKLLFNIHSRVKHFHSTSFWRYLKVQARHGYYRMWMYLRHPQRMKGDAYSSMIDHMQPLLAIMVLLSLPLAFVPGFRWWPLMQLLLLVLVQIPMTQRLVQRVGPKYALFAMLSFIRSFARGLGMTCGVFRHGVAKLRAR